MALWTPADLAVGPWLDIDSDNAVWSGSNLTSITNPGSGNNGSVSLLGTPTKGATANGHESIRLTSAGGLSAPQAAYGPGGAMFVFAVHQLTASTPREMLVNANGWAPSAGLGIYIGDGTPQAWSAWNGYDPYNNGMAVGTGPAYKGGSVPTSTTAPTIQSWLASASAVQSRINAQLVSLSASDASAVPNYSAGDYSIGAQSGGSEPANTDLFRLVILRYIPTTDEREKLEGWASWKYAGDGSLLPSGHTYKSAAPTTGGSGISGSASITEANDTVASASVLALKAAANLTESGDTSSASGAVRITALASITEAGDTLTAAGATVSPITGAATLTEAGDTLVSAARVSLRAGASISETGDSLSAASALRIVAQASITEDSDTLSANDNNILLAYPIRAAQVALATARAGQTLTAYPVRPAQEAN